MYRVSSSEIMTSHSIYLLWQFSSQSLNDIHSEIKIQFIEIKNNHYGFFITEIQNKPFNSKTVFYNLLLCKLFIITWLYMRLENNVYNHKNYILRLVLFSSGNLAVSSIEDHKSFVNETGKLFVISTFGSLQNLFIASNIFQWFVYNIFKTHSHWYFTRWYRP